MPSPFAITAAANTVPLDSNRKGQTSFTVSNTTTQPLRGHARLWTQPTTAGPWISLVGDAERDFPAAESQQFAIQISVPPTAPASDYTFRLDVVDVVNPDDNFTQGPTVKFVVPAPVVEKKPFPWWIVAVILGVLLLIGGSFGIIRAIQNSSANTAHAHATATAVAQINATATAQANATATIVALMNATATAQAQTFGQFDGNWINNDPNTNDIARLIITNAGSTITVHGFGRCGSGECDWNTRSGTYFGSPFTILFDFGGGLTHQLTISTNADRTQLFVVDIGSASGVINNTFHKG